MIFEKYGSKDELELALFKVIDFEGCIDVADYIPKIRLEEVFGYQTDFCVAVKQIEDFMILKEGEEFLVIETTKYKAGDLFLCDTSTLVELNGNFNWKHIEKLGDKIPYNSRIDLDDLEIYDFVDEKILLEWINAVIKEAETERLEEERRRKDEEKREKKQTESEESIFKRTGIIKNSYFDVGGNKIDVLDDIIVSDTFILDKNIQQTILEYDDFPRSYSYRGRNDIMRNTLIDKQISFTQQKPTKPEVKVGFENGKTTLNGIKVSKAKLRFLLTRLEADNWDIEKIKKYNKLTGMKADLIEMKDFSVNIPTRNEHNDYLSLNLPITIELTDFEDTFKVSAWGVEKEISWDKLKDYFFYEGKSRSIGNHFGTNKILTFASEFVDKAEALNYLKKAKILKSLESKSSED